jgi:hypothetical protein
MNANEMLDYALGQLDAPARERVERELAADPAAARTADRLGRALHALLDDGEPFEPPAGLTQRTNRLVVETARRRTILDFVPVVVPFRPADIAVAAGIFLAGLLTLLPAVQKSRERMDVAGCTYNLQQLGRALWQYGSRHEHYPFGPEQDPAAPTGSFVSMLNDSGLLTESDLRALDCPCRGRHHDRTRHDLLDFPSVCRLQATDPQRVKDAICSDYAYNVGHYHPSGRVVPVAARYSARIPLLADQPPHQNFRSLLEGNSPNHAGRGQNVLYTDLHVGWHNTRRLGPQDSDMFLNARRQLAPGVDAEDTAMLPSMVPFLGWGASR